MAYTTEQLHEYMNGISDDAVANLKMLLYYADLDEAFAEDEAWGQVCEFAMSVDEELGQSAPYIEKYMGLIAEEKFAEALAAMEHDLLDNYVFAAMAIHRMPIPKDMPMVAANAGNRHEFVGLRSEFAIMRFLHWSGFDISAPIKRRGDMTPLHYMASTKYLPGSHTRAVKWLVDHGADVDAVNTNGDTPLIYLAAVEGWGDQHAQSFAHILDAGADPFLPAKDGTCAYDLLVQLNDREFHQVRQDVIDRLAKNAEVPEQPDDSSEQVAGAGDAPQVSKAEQLAKFLRQARARVDVIRDFYQDEEAQAKNREENGDDAWDTSSVDEYLERLFEMTVGLAIRNNLYGRPELFSPEVAAVMAEDPRFAYLMSPKHITPLIEFMRADLTSKLFGRVRRPNQEQYAAQVLGGFLNSDDLIRYLAFPTAQVGKEGRLIDVEASFEEGDLAKVEEDGFPSSARAGLANLLSSLVDSGWIWPFMQVGDKELPKSFSVGMAASVINAGMGADEVAGRALVLALLGFAARQDGGVYDDIAIDERAWSPVGPKDWCDAAGRLVDGLALAWGLPDLPTPMWDGASEAIPEESLQAGNANEPNEPVHVEHKAESPQPEQLVEKEPAANPSEVPVAITEPQAPSPEAIAKPVAEQQASAAPASSAQAASSEASAGPARIAFNSTIFNLALKNGSDFQEILPNGKGVDSSADKIRERLTAEAQWSGAAFEPTHIGAPWIVITSYSKFTFQSLSSSILKRMEV